ncbi:ClpP/crotonase-like domain-containing protein [Morchella snyderi]|nr:ClpP/crotonase-like domain-containing protein [Morchella snyderi]
MPPYPTALPAGITTPPPPLAHTLIAFPTPQILLATINRPQHMNCINTAGHHEMHNLWEWYDAEPTLRCAIVTGAGGGRREAFCAGQDLKEWHASATTPTTTTTTTPSPPHPPSGFAGLSQRTGKKPIITAISGLTLGGGLELTLNADLTLCTPTSTFALPEAQIGVAAFAGALPRLALLVGLPRASELAYTGRVLSAREAEAWGVVNRVVGADEDVVGAAVELAGRVARCSPESVVVSRAGLRSAWEAGGVAERVKGVWEGVGAVLRGGENVKEGLASFVEGREPRWGVSKL